MKKIFLVILLTLSSCLLTTTNGYFAKAINSENKGIMACVEMYQLIEKYCNVYEIPKYIAYNIAYLETKYMGPFHFNYNPYIKSNLGALGAMQIMPSTANVVNDKIVSKKELKNNLELNISTSMKLLNRLYEKYQDWGKVCASYNTGKPNINKYAIYCIRNKSYIDKWVLTDFILNPFIH